MDACVIYFTHNLTRVRYTLQQNSKSSLKLHKLFLDDSLKAFSNAMDRDRVNRLRQARVHRSSEVPVFVEVTPFELAVGTELTFNKILLESIDDALSSLGEPVKESIYYNLEKIFNIKRYDIPCRIDEFCDALERIFGLGAKPLQIMFMKHLNDRVGIVCKWDFPKWVVPDLTFKQYVLLMKQNFDQSKTSPRQL